MRDLIDVQLTYDGEPVGGRYVTEVDAANEVDRVGAYVDALVHVGARTTAGYRLEGFRRGTDERLFWHPAAPRQPEERIGPREVFRRLREIWMWKG